MTRTQYLTDFSQRAKSACEATATIRRQNNNRKKKGIVNENHQNININN